MAQISTTVFYVDIECAGCTKSISSLLKKVEGVNNVEFDIPNKKVYVTGNANKEDMINAIQKSGKKVLSPNTQ